MLLKKVWRAIREFLAMGSRKIGGVVPVVLKKWQRESLGGRIQRCFIDLMMLNTTKLLVKNAIRIVIAGSLWKLAIRFLWNFRSEKVGDSKNCHNEMSILVED